MLPTYLLIPFEIYKPRRLRKPLKKPYGFFLSRFYLSKHLLILSFIRVSANLLMLQTCSSPHSLRIFLRWKSIVHVVVFRYWESFKSWYILLQATQLFNVWVPLELLGEHHHVCSIDCVINFFHSSLNIGHILYWVYSEMLYGCLTFFFRSE